MVQEEEELPGEGAPPTGDEVMENLFGAEDEVGESMGEAATPRDASSAPQQENKESPMRSPPRKIQRTEADEHEPQVTNAD